MFAASILTGIPVQASSGVLEQAFSDGKASLDMRYRYEGVDDSVNQDAKASTLRTRLGFTTDKSLDLYAHADFEHVTRVGPPDYNSTQNGQTQYAVVADPMVTELNQASLIYQGLDKSLFNLGRQRIIFDNARFVGNVGWRQNEQTFDAIRYTGTFTDEISLNLVNIQQVNTILGGRQDSNHNLVNFSLDKLAGGKLTAYAYLLDYDTGVDSATYGLRYKGKYESLLYTLEYAKQDDHADNNSGLSTDYLFAELGYKFEQGFSISLGYELLGSDSGLAGFQTPLATKHAFNGWADKFLVTPNTGLEDIYLKAAGKVAGVKLVGVYHEYAPDEGTGDYGSEINLLVAKKLNKTFTGVLKYADYSADNFSADTSKLWLMLEMKLGQ